MSKKTKTKAGEILLILQIIKLLQDTNTEDVDNTDVVNGLVTALDATEEDATAIVQVASEIDSSFFECILNTLGGIGKVAELLK